VSVLWGLGGTATGNLFNDSKKTFSGIICCFTVCNSRKSHLSVIVFVVGLRLEVIVVGEVVV